MGAVAYKVSILHREGEYAMKARKSRFLLERRERLSRRLNAYLSVAHEQAEAASCHRCMACPSPSKTQSGPEACVPRAAP